MTQWGCQCRGLHQKNARLSRTIVESGLTFATTQCNNIQQCAALASQICTRHIPGRKHNVNGAILLFSPAIVETDDKLIAVLITLRSCKFLSYNIINHYAVFLYLVTLATCITQSILSSHWYLKQHAPTNAFFQSSVSQDYSTLTPEKGYDVQVPLQEQC